MAFLLVLLRPAWVQGQEWPDRIRGLAMDGAVAVADAEGNMVLAINIKKPMVPASILKIVTAAAALDFLGPEYHFVTEFRLSPENDLYVVGRGDPYLISEELALIARRLKAQGLEAVGNLFLDGGFFRQGLVLDGTNRSLNPYDAYNGALCVNFNTIYAEIGPGNRVASAEPQTPLTDLARELALKSGVRGKERFNLAQSPETCLRYAGELFKAFLLQAGIQVKGRIAPAQRDPAGIPLLYRHHSSKNLGWVVSQMFKYSNNFVANQIFLTLGAEKYGPPAEAQKSRRVVAGYLRSNGIKSFHIEEGSGLSRLTKITAAQMLAVLKLFEPYRSLLTSEGPALVKTGTLLDVKSMAGYLVPEKGRPLRFVLLLSGSGKALRNRARILSLLEENLL